MEYASVNELLSSIKGICDISGGDFNLTDSGRLKSELIDTLVYNGVFNTDISIKKACQWVIYQSANSMGIKPASIHQLYEARGRGDYKGVTVPAMNIRGLTYDVVRAVMRAAVKNNVGAFILEIARSEIVYTGQSPAEYAVVILASAIKEGFRGPLFIQGDHFQFKLKNFSKDPDTEFNAIKALTEEAINAGFYNIDIDSSTLVDLSKSNISEQQKDNFEQASKMTAFIRQIEPKGITVSVGGEIGEIGHSNSTAEELRAFMDGYISHLKGVDSAYKGLSKISVQTGTAHGGVVLPDGTVAKVKLDFDTLKRLSELARAEYGMGGAVQHGASTLPEDLFHKFPEIETVEIHLATQFQNMIYEHPSFPKELRADIYEYLKTEHSAEKKTGQTEEQFIYKTRKRAFGAFKKRLWDIPEKIRDAISMDLEKKFEFLFHKLNAINTQDLVKRHITTIDVSRTIPDVLKTLV